MPKLTQKLPKTEFFETDAVKERSKKVFHARLELQLDVE